MNGIFVIVNNLDHFVAVKRFIIEVTYSQHARIFTHTPYSKETVITAEL